MQHQLDSYIEKEKNVADQDLFDKKVIALLVEVGELANETRCFKFWSEKGPSEKSVILEEYVDGVHFLLSLGIEKQLRFQPDSTPSSSRELTAQFFELYGVINSFALQPSQETYNRMWECYLKVGQELGFTSENIMAAYSEKNEVNIKRQQQGY
ncbi:dUTPase [Jeotgalibacillus proteolyticus]|uniref:dUTPase n=2 Tax=Jeotgalibacillus proteolyticus TaxID=2082395 RepID=A0A2S5GFQ7_9BACL|nr:dUTPase [Jeotgalibacillus proteolyticus]